MIPDFEDALNKLLEQYEKNTTRDTIISTLELALMAQREQAEADANDESGE